jgi:hypothetical protein
VVAFVAAPFAPKAPRFLFFGQYGFDDSMPVLKAGKAAIKL